MNHIKLLLCGFAAAALFSLNVGCQPAGQDEAELEVDTDTGVPVEAEGVEEDANITTGVETPESNITTGTETPGTETP